MKLLSYIDVLKGNAEVGKRVAIIGAGGIGYDVADFLTHDHASHPAVHPGTKLSGKVDKEVVTCNVYLFDLNVYLLIDANVFSCVVMF